MPVLNLAVDVTRAQLWEATYGAQLLVIAHSAVGFVRYAYGWRNWLTAEFRFNGESYWPC